MRHVALTLVLASASAQAADRCAEVRVTTAKALDACLRKCEPTLRVVNVEKTTNIVENRTRELAAIDQRLAAHETLLESLDACEKQCESERFAFHLARTQAPCPLSPEEASCSADEDRYVILARRVLAYRHAEAIVKSIGAHADVRAASAQALVDACERARHPSSKECVQTTFESKPVVRCGGVLCTAETAEKRKTDALRASLVARQVQEVDKGIAATLALYETKLLKAPRCASFPLAPADACVSADDTACAKRAANLAKCRTAGNGIWRNQLTREAYADADRSFDIAREKIISQLIAITKVLGDPTSLLSQDCKERAAILLRCKEGTETSVLVCKGIDRTPPGILRKAKCEGEEATVRASKQLERDAANEALTLIAERASLVRSLIKYRTSKVELGREHAKKLGCNEGP